MPYVHLLIESLQQADKVDSIMVPIVKTELE